MIAKSAYAVAVVVIVAVVTVVAVVITVVVIISPTSRTSARVREGGGLSPYISKKQHLC